MKVPTLTSQIMLLSKPYGHTQGADSVVVIEFHGKLYDVVCDLNGKWSLIPNLNPEHVTRWQDE